MSQCNNSQLKCTEFIEIKRLSSFVSIEIQQYLNIKIKDYTEDDDLSSVKLYILISNILLYVEPTFSVIGLLGNIIVCFVIIRSKSMHTVTNCYLFSLSVSDLILLIIGSSLDIYVLYGVYNAQLNINIFRTLSDIPMYICTTTITAFTIERYLAICHPLYTYKTSDVRRTVKLLILVWIISFSISFPGELITLLTQLGIITVDSEFWEELPFDYQCFNTAVFLVLPIVIITTLYILIGWRISKGRKIRAARTVNVTQRTSLVMMGVIIVVTILCWTPAFMMKLILRNAWIAGDIIEMLGMPSFFILDDLSRFLLRLSPVVNPIIYSAMSLKFRRAFKDTVINPFRNLHACRKSLSGNSRINDGKHRSRMDDRSITIHEEL